MSTTLEEALKLACAKGMTHLTLYPAHTAGKDKIYWACRATPSAQHAYVFCNSEDPIEAVLETLKALPKAKGRAAISKDRGRNYEARHTPVTATATETPPQPETFDTWLPKT